ncbi:MAG TPA: hypothetical protein VFC63_07890 [Blastocatellia bacterium]|nr:hypothetical protein [Blastocatellia bacterium]
MVNEKHANLPPLYEDWINEILAGPIPRETSATCDDCAMVTPSNEANNDTGYYFSAKSKCCTYLPQLPNFTVGRILADESPEMEFGRRSVEARISSKCVVSPFGVGRPAVYSLLYKESVNAFGRSQSLLCPHYVEQSGHCGIWKYRGNVCAFWFCKFDRGIVGMQFWELMRQLFSAVEEELAEWCVLQLNPGTEALRCLNASQANNGTSKIDGSALDGNVDEKRYQRIWGNWHNREREFYQECAELVRPLGWSDVLERCGPKVPTLALLTRQAHKELTSHIVPERLRQAPIQLVRSNSDGDRVTTYSKFDPLELPKPMMNLLHYFDGRPTGEVLQQIAEDEGIRLDSGAVRKLTDFEILVPCSD